MKDLVLTLESSKTSWNTHESLKGTHPQCIAFDPIKPNRAYCGTFGNGLWKTDDGGESWDNIGMDNISSKDVTSVSVSHLEREGTTMKGSIQYMLERNLLHSIDLIMKVNLGRK
jgi:hypothetical protein